MLRVVGIGRGRFSYYLDTVANGRGQKHALVEPDGVWVGAHARALGLAGSPVTSEDLSALLDGVDPVTGEVLDPRHSRVSVAAYDCTFAAPKSVSLVHGISGDPAVVAEVARAHEASVEGAVEYLEHEAANVRRRGGGDDRVVRSGGFAAASFVHRSSRALDPHLHSHVLVANLGRDGDGRWSALDARAMFVHSRTAGALYRAQLRAELVARLGVTWRWRPDGFADLAGIRPEVLRTFSRRTAEIEAALASSGRPGVRSARVAALTTREPKDLSTPYDELVAGWRERAERAGVSARGIAAVVPGRSRVELAALAAVRRQRRGAPEVTDEPFTRRGFVAARADSLEDGAAAADVVARADRELRAAIADGSVRTDPDPAAPRHGLRARSGASIPSGVDETPLVTARYLERERELARRIATARPLCGAARAPGLWRPSSPSSQVLDVGEEVAGVLGDAARAGRPVLVLAPDRTSASHAEALLGRRALVSTRPPAVPPGAVAVVLAVEAWKVSSLEGIVERSSTSSIVLVASNEKRSRQLVRDAVERVWPAVPGERGPVTPRPGATARDVRPSRHEVPGAEVVLVAGARDLPLAAARERERLAAETGEAVVVVAGDAVAAAVTRALGAVTPVVPAKAVRSGATATVGGLVVVGGASLLGRRGDLGPRVHVAVAPAELSSKETARWAARLAGAPPALERAAGIERGAGRGQARDARRSVRLEPPGLGIG